MFKIYSGHLCCEKQTKHVAKCTYHTINNYSMSKGQHRMDIKTDFLTYKGPQF
jgi:hypothetical protein